MTIRIFFKPAGRLAALAGAFLPLWTGPGYAQTPEAAPLVFRSAFEGYQPYTDEKMVAWQRANDSVGQIGGWREYAKEASRPDSSPPVNGAAARDGLKAGSKAEGAKP